MVGIYQEKNLDVICIGGSSTFVYWEPFYAWKQWGITSYDLATDSVRPPVMLGYVRQALKKKPDLMVIDLRSYALTGQSEQLSDSEGGLRNMVDSLDNSWNRLKTIFDINGYYDLGLTNENIWSWVFDIEKYHDNYDRFGNEENWKHLNNRTESDNKGFVFSDYRHQRLAEPSDFKTSKCARLDTNVEKNLIELLDFLQKSNAQVLFVATPKVITMDEEENYNAISKIVESYGYNFLNTNDYYEQMNLDFSTDFYHPNHVNVLGAEKYTQFCASYIKSNYELEDHREDPTYKEWDTSAEQTLIKEKKIRESIEEIVRQKNEAHDRGIDLRNIEQAYEWINKAHDSNYSILLVSKGGVTFNDSSWDVYQSESEEIKVCISNDVVYESKENSLESNFTGNLGTDEVTYEINSGCKVVIDIAGTVYTTDKEGTYVVVFDNNYNDVLDAVRINQDGDKLLLQHIMN